MGLVSGLYKMGTPGIATVDDIERRLRRKLKRLVEELGKQEVLRLLANASLRKEDEAVRDRLIAFINDPKSIVAVR